MSDVMMAINNNIMKHKNIVNVLRYQSIRPIKYKM